MYESNIGDFVITLRFRVEHPVSLRNLMKYTVVSPVFFSKAQKLSKLKLFIIKDF